MYVKLHGRSHPDPETLQRGILMGHGPYEYQGYKGFKRPLQDPWRQRSNGLKVLTISKVLGRQGFPCEVHGFKGVMCQSPQTVSKVLGR